MKKLISAKTIRDAVQEGKTEVHFSGKQTIITPEARSIAEKLNIALRETENSPMQDSTYDADEATIRVIIERVLLKLPEEKQNLETIRDTVIAVLKNHQK